MRIVHVFLILSAGLVLTNAFIKDTTVQHGRVLPRVFSTLNPDVQSSEVEQLTNTKVKPKKVKIDPNDLEDAHIEVVTAEELRELKRTGRLDPNVYYETSSSAPKQPKIKSDVKTPEELKQERLREEARKTIHETTGLNYTDPDGNKYDAPYLDESRWYWLQTRKNSERRIAETLKTYAQTNKKFKGKVFDAFSPQNMVVRMKKNSLSCGFTPMLPGLIYVKSKMSAAIADLIEDLPGVYGLTKNRFQLVVPLSVAKGAELEYAITKQLTDLPEELKLIKRDEYVSVTGGKFEGRYGIFNGVRSGECEVALRNAGRKDDIVTIAPELLAYLPNPPEIKWTEMTIREACESLISKDPNSRTLRDLKSEGMLEDILYGTEDPNAIAYLEKDRAFQRRRAARAEQQQRESGVSSNPIDTSFKRERSIAKSSFDTSPYSKNAAASTNPNPRVWEPKGWSSSDSASKSSSMGNTVSGKNAAEVQGEENFDDFIEGLLSDMESPGADRIAVGGSVGQDRVDDSGTFGGGEEVGADWLLDSGDGDVDELLAAMMKDLDGAQLTSPPVSASTSKEASTSGAPPDMSQYSSFETYLSALVDYEKGGAPPASTPTPSTKPAAKTDLKATASDYSSMSVSELKDVLREKGMPISGTKAVLLERLAGK